MATIASPAWLVSPGQVVLFDGRAAKVVGCRWVNGGRRRKWRIVYRAHDGKLVFEDFLPGEWLTVITTDVP